jgi:acetoin utilization protein AcuB
MLVRNRMTPDPQTVTPRDTLAVAVEKMARGHFRRLPVVENSTLVGILTERDLRRHVGIEERTRVEAAMTERPVTVSASTPIEEAIQLMLKHQVGGLPVVADGRLVGVVTASDVMQAFVEASGATVKSSVRIDLLQEADKPDLAEAASIISKAGGTVLGIGTYRDHWGPVFYIRLHGMTGEQAQALLQDKGYTILQIQGADVSP